LIGFGGSMALNFFPHTVNRLDILLLNRFYPNRVHIRSSHRLTDRLCIIGIVFIAFHKRLNELWGNDRYLITPLNEQPGPVMGTGTGFHTDLCSRPSGFA
jgi:hypothetical protein